MVTLLVTIITFDIRYITLLAIVDLAVVLYLFVIPKVRARLPKRYIDKDLLFLIIHLYSLSTGRPHRKRLFELRNVLGGYGEYERILRRVSVLATNWGYGFIRAIHYVARYVRHEEFRNFLLRLSEVLRTGEDPVSYLDIEARSMVRLYEYAYNRSLDGLKIILALYASIMSATSFMILTLAILAIFTGGDTFLLISSSILLSMVVAIMAVAVVVTIPKDWFSPKRIGRAYYFNKYMTLSILAMLIIVVIGYYVFSLSSNIMASVASASIPMVIPSIYAILIEDRIKKINNSLPIFIRSFGAFYAVLRNQVRALQASLQAELGTLRKYIERLYSRLSNNINPRICWKYLGLETWNDNLIRVTNIMVDTVEVNGNTAEVGTFLNDVLATLNNLYVARVSIARTFEATVYMMQTLITAIGASLIAILRSFAMYFESLRTLIGAYVPPTALPISLSIPNVDAIALAFSISLLILAFINAIVLKFAFGGLKETFWTHLMVLLFLTSGAWYAMEYVSKMLVIPILVGITS